MATYSELVIYHIRTCTHACIPIATEITIFPKSPMYIYLVCYAYLATMASL